MGRTLGHSVCSRLGRGEGGIERDRESISEGIAVGSPYGVPLIDSSMRTGVGAVVGTLVGIEVGGPDGESGFSPTPTAYQAL